ncbi:MAG TPA: nucleotide pyrophosphatase/phosphodiesterase family protein [Pirellulales bacterium]|jgi:predicted AlkP superfamily pyrophosphatase or phosphodiesterase|nr:nucleotide pyrophosphatase/phosphodiesterase family protein [Pirellulales bacterium]
MADHVVLLSVPGLRATDLAAMPNLSRLVAEGDRAALSPSFPCLTCPVQANMTTGKMPAQHGVVANGFYWPERHEVEMWTAWNDAILSPQIWDILHQHDSELRSAVWFPLLAKGAGADWICTPAPIHNPDGSESLWCYTQPTEMYGELRDALGHFPLQHFWGPLANIRSTAWIVDSAIHLARRERPNFFYIYLPHLDYAAQKSGPDSPAASQALVDLDEVLGRLFAAFQEIYSGSDRKEEPLWLVASEYTIWPVDHVTYPNRVLREAGLLAVKEQPDGEYLDIPGSTAWAMVDHQLSHVYIQGGAESIERVRKLFTGREGIAEVLLGEDLARYELNHERSGQIVLVSAANSWQAYYWWLDDRRAPPFARTVDIHRKPGYDPVELHFDPATKSIPLDATRVRGSHGAPVREAWQQGVLLTSQRGVLEGPPMADTDVFDLVLRQFGI